MTVVEIVSVELAPGKGRGSLRKGRTGLIARIVTDDDGESFYVIVNRTEAGQLVADGQTVSTNFSADELEAARDWAKAEFKARGWIPRRSGAGRV